MQELELGKKKLGWRDTGVLMVVIGSEFTFLCDKENDFEHAKSLPKVNNKH